MGTRYLLEVIEDDAAPTVVTKARHDGSAGSSRNGRGKETNHVSGWYPQQIKPAASELTAKWEPILGVRVNGVFVQRMKTRWGGCNTDSNTIRLNTELAKKPRECLEYIIVHELVHLLERHHTERFTVLMDEHLPQWGQLRKLLNTAPLGHETWRY